MLLKFSPSMMKSMPMGRPKRPPFMSTLQTPQSDGSSNAAANANRGLLIRGLRGRPFSGLLFSPTAPVCIRARSSRLQRLLRSMEERAPRRLSDEAPPQLTPARRAIFSGTTPSSTLTLFGRALEGQTRGSFVRRGQMRSPNGLQHLACHASPRCAEEICGRAS